MILEILAVILASIVVLVGLVITLFGLPGTFVVLSAAVIYDLVTWSWAASKFTLVVLLAIALLGELFEWVFTLYGAKKFKTSNFAIIGLIVGTIAGAIIGVPVPIIGSVIGALLGAFIGAFVFSYIEHRRFQKSMEAGIGAFLTRIGVIFMKLFLAIIMAVIFYLAL